MICWMPHPALEGSRSVHKRLLLHQHLLLLIIIIIIIIIYCMLCKSLVSYICTHLDASMVSPACLHACACDIAIEQTSRILFLMLPIVPHHHHRHHR